MLHIHEALQSGSYPNCRSLAEELSHSTKTIQRDIDFLRDTAGLPIDYDSARHGYYYTDPVEAFPLLTVSEGELLALFVARQALPQLAGTPFESPLTSAVQKLTHQIATETRLSLADLQRYLSFRVTGLTTANLASFKAISQAALQSRELHFDYCKLGGAQPEPRHVQPYHLANINHNWYLIAHDIARNDTRTFALSRIQGTPSTGKAFQRPKDFCIEKLLASSFGVFRGSDLHPIHLRFDAFAAPIVRERQWHPSQIVQDMDDGTLELRIQLDSLEEIKRWVLSWGRHCTILAPAELRAAVHREALGILTATAEAAPQWLNDLAENAQAMFQAEDPAQRLLNLE